jgi:protein-L-isoaspartate(D-aspartate) O-methyltransferase
MIEIHLRGRDIRDPRVLRAMAKVPRHLFVPPHLRAQAYADRPLPIGQGQTISQPYIVALMTQLVRPQPGDKVLEIGTGSGYQAAVLAELAGEVYTIEIIPELAEQAKRRLKELGYENIHVRTGDGYKGWPEVAPFDAIVVTAAPSHVPPPLLEQLADGGRLVIPVDTSIYQQTLKLITRQGDNYREEDITGVAFVPLVDEEGRKR